MSIFDILIDIVRRYRMKNKKGFTLVELLAVVVILALIALIASPIILNIIENSRKSSFASSMDGAVRAIENFYSVHYNDEGFNRNATYKYSNGRLYYVGTLNGIPDQTIEISGNLGNGIGSGMVDSDGKVTFHLESNGFCGDATSSGVSVDKCK